MTRPPGRFAYWRDPLFVAALSAYAINRWAIALLLPTWWQGHFADLLLVPVGLPLWLWCERRVGWRDHDGIPRWREIAFVLVVWAVAAELVAPWMFAHATGDGWDVLAYAIGAFTAGLAWRTRARGAAVGQELACMPVGAPVYTAHIRARSSAG